MLISKIIFKKIKNIILIHFKTPILENRFDCTTFNDLKHHYETLDELKIFLK